MSTLPTGPESTATPDRAAHAAAEGEDADRLDLWWPEEADTQAAAERLAEAAALRQVHIALHGQLGAGKTSFVRHLLRALGVAGRIKSPSYAIVEPHELPARPPQAAAQAWHFDFYRFADPREWEDAGFRELFAAPGLKLVEWPEQAAGLLPRPDLDLHLRILDDGQSRAATWQAHSQAGRGLLDLLR